MAGEAYGGNLYRYKNSRGFTVLDDRLPAENVSNGYEVLSKSGRVLKVVPAYVDKPEVDVEQQRAVDIARGREDKYILASYDSRKQIRNTGERKLKQLGREIKIIERNLIDIGTQRRSQRTRAADYQRSGRSVPATITDSLRKLVEDEGKASSLLDGRRKEYAAMVAMYTRYELRFAELTGEPIEDAAEPLNRDSHEGG